MSKDLKEERKASEMSDGKAFQVEEGPAGAKTLIWDAFLFT